MVQLQWVTRILLAGALTLGSHLVLAGAADVVNSDGSTMKFEYRGDKLRINPQQDESSYMLLRDGHLYVVTNNDGQPMVIDANQAMGMFGSVAAAAAPKSVASEVVTLEPTGRLEKHAGITGEVYELEYVTEDGGRQRGELVLSDDERAKAFSKALADMAHSLSKTVGKNYDDAMNDMQQRLNALDMGVLRYGEDMRISAISERTVAEARFELPVPPTDLSNIGALMNQSRASSSSTGSRSSSQNQGQSSGSGGVMGSFLEALGGGKSSEEDSAAEDEATADEDADGNPLGKAFGKLFGK
jgi:hypothetical protein